MKVDARRAQIQKALEDAVLKNGALKNGLDGAGLRELMEKTGASADEVRAVLEELGDRFTHAGRRAIERLLAQDGAREPSAPTSAAPAQRVHDVRAARLRPWWSAVRADPLPPPLYPEPARDVEVNGERITKQDLADLLRSLTPR
jgi:hypothetical protein